MRTKTCYGHGVKSLDRWKTTDISDRLALPMFFLLFCTNEDKCRGTNFISSDADLQHVVIMANEFIAGNQFSINQNHQRSNNINPEFPTIRELSKHKPSLRDTKKKMPRNHDTKQSDITLMA